MFVLLQLVCPMRTSISLQAQLYRSISNSFKFSFSKHHFKHRGNFANKFLQSKIVLPFFNRPVQVHESGDCLILSCLLNIKTFVKQSGKIGNFKKITNLLRVAFSRCFASNSHYHFGYADWSCWDFLGQNIWRDPHCKTFLQQKQVT